MIELGSIIRYGYLGELMYLRLKTNRGRKYLLMMESVHDPETGKCVKRVVKSYGRYENLPEEVRRAFEDERARKQLTAELERDCLNARLTMAAEAAEAAVKAADVAKVDDDGLECDDTPRLNGAFELHYGHLALKPIWEMELGLKYKISYLQQAYTEIEEWSLNDLLFYLASVKIVRPQSYLQASNNISDFIYCPWSSVSQSGFDYAQDFLYEHGSQLLKYAVKTHAKPREKPVKTAFISCFNIWLEAATHGNALFGCSLHDSCDLEMMSHGACLADAYADCGPDSCEGLPVISVALAADEEGFPLDCRISLGTPNDLDLLPEAVQALKDQYGISNYCLIAESLSNEAQVVRMARHNDMGFVVPFHLSKQSDEDRRQMLDLSGYKNFIPGDDGTYVLESNDSRIQENAPRIKVCDFVMKVRSAAEPCWQYSSELAGAAEVPCRIVYTFCPQRRARDLALLNALKQSAVAAKGLNDERIKAKEKVAGYAALVLGHSGSSKHLPLSDAEVLDSCYRLAGLKDSFKLMTVSLFPDSPDEKLIQRIEAHCCLSVLALMMLRIVQKQLLQKGHRMSLSGICQALADARVIPASVSNSEINFFNVMSRSGDYAPVAGNAGTREPLSMLETADHGEEISSGYEQGKRQISSGAQTVLDAVGLGVIPRYVGFRQLKRLLKIGSYPDSKVLADEHQQLIKLLDEQPPLTRGNRSSELPF